IATLHELGRDELIRILIEPKNAITKQYEKLFELESVKLHFPEETIQAIADYALERDTGARGLRSILEDVMLNVMFDIPSRKDIRECVVTPGVIRNHEEPLIVYEQEPAARSKDKPGRSASA
ncbi:MAG TPA: ATP-dependent Clp protease ATP-binding subunit ClpX, partial [Candidatus Hydrogenedentes bacterium]|nr:ATP-dependent Clp protease ATP-binding subunit ClpX [Candidatus Hydrogenedentota bacterium]